MDVSQGAIGSHASRVSLACPAIHISPFVRDFAALSACESGRAVELDPYEKDPNLRPTPPLRREITTFSRASRRRLLWLIAQIAQPILANSLFLTLTYPKGDSNAPDHAKHLDTLLKRLRRHAPNASAIWKLEYTKAQTPHFHLLVLGLDFWHHQAIAKAWAEIVRSDNPNHEQAGTRVERTHSHRNVARYIVKYVAKSSPYPEDHRGRVWGKSGPIHLAFSPKVIYSIARSTYAQIRRTFDKIRQAQKRDRGFNRSAKTTQKQRWFLSGSEVIRYLRYLAVEPITCGPT